MTNDKAPLRRLILGIAMSALLFLVPLILTSTSPMAFAQDVDIDFDKLESRGLYNKKQEGSLGHDFWKNTPRSALIKLIETLPANSQNPSIRKLILGTLLTRADSKKIKNDIEPEAGHDLLTLRLNKLLEGGYYAQAHALYTQSESAPYHENLAKAGILSFLFTGQKALACLETNTFHGDFIESDFIQKAYAYCELSLSGTRESTPNTPKKRNKDDVLLSMSQDKAFTFAYTAGTFKKLTALEQAFLISEGKIKTRALRPADVKNIPIAHLPFLLASDDLKEDTRFHTTLKALQWGLSSSKDLEDLYNSVAQKKNKGTGDSPSPNNWRALADHLNAANKATHGQEKWDAVRKSFPFAQTYGIQALRPFTNIIAESEPEITSIDEISLIYSLLILSDQAIPTYWLKIIEHILEKEYKKSDKDRLENLLSTAYISGLKPTKGLKNHEERLALWYRNSCNSRNAQKNIIENLDKPASNVDNHLRIYENDFDLTCSNSYVMPTTHVWDRLIQASQERNIGEIILLSIKVLHEIPPKDMYPRLFQDVLKILNHVGLTDISEGLAVEAILGNIK